MKTLGAFLFFSLMVHLMSYTGFSLLELPAYQSPLTTLTEIEIVQDSDLEKISADEKPVVKQLDAKNSLLGPNEARFSSEKTQRVEQETKVEAIGTSRNRSAAADSPKIDLDSDEIAAPEFTRSVNAKNLRSQLGDELPKDIPVADTTNLNTDANIYYTFYDRVEQLFRVRWVERLNYNWDRIPFEFKKEYLAGRIWSTTFEVVLKQTGEYHSAEIIQSSGYKPFDEAAIYSFKNARFFPNIPKAKVEPDGFVRLKYRFNLHVGSYL